MRKLKRDAIIIASGRLLMTLLSMLTIKAMAFYLSKEELGKFGLLMAILTGFSLGLLNPLSNYFNRKMHSWLDEGVLLHAFLIFSIFVGLLGSVAAPVIYILCMSGEVVSNIQPIFVSAFVGLGLILFHGFAFVPALINLLQKRQAFVIISVLGYLAVISASVLMVIIYDASAINWAIGHMLGWMLTSLVSVIFLYNQFKRFQKESITRSVFMQFDKKEIYSFVGHLIPTSLLLWVMTDGFRLFAESHVSIAYLGILAVCLGLPQKVGTAIEGVTQQLYSPIFYQEINTNDKSAREFAFSNYFDFVFPIYFISAFYLIGISPYFLRLMTVVEYIQYFQLAILGIIIQFLRNLSNLFASVAHSEKRTDILIWPYLTGVILTLSFIWWRASNEPVWVIYSLLIGYLVILLGMILNASRLIQFYFDKSKILELLGLSAPMLLALIWYDHAESFIFSIAMIFLALPYMIILQVRCYKAFTKKILHQQS